MSLSTVFVHFADLPVGEETQMRGSLREDGVSYFVARKTLMNIALKETSIKGEQPELVGEIAIAYNSGDPSTGSHSSLVPLRSPLEVSLRAHPSESKTGRGDPTAPARGVYTFVKKYKDKLSIVGGIFEGHFLDAKEMNEIATIPPVETLRGMFANVINSPIQGLVIALNAIAEKKV